MKLKISYATTGPWKDGLEKKAYPEGYRFYISVEDKGNAPTNLIFVYEYDREMFFGGNDYTGESSIYKSGVFSNFEELEIAEKRLLKKIALWYEQFKVEDSNGTVLLPKCVQL